MMPCRAILISRTRERSNNQQSYRRCSEAANRVWPVFLMKWCNLKPRAPRWRISSFRGSCQRGPMSETPQLSIYANNWKSSNKGPKPAKRPRRSSNREGLHRRRPPRKNSNDNLTSSTRLLWPPPDNRMSRATRCPREW